MNTKSLNISLPEDLKTKAKQLAVEQKHGSVGRYIQYLLRREAEKDTERKKCYHQCKNEPVHRLKSEPVV